MNNSTVGLVFLVLIQFLSLSCALYVLIHCIKKQNTLRNLPNHLIICLLIVSTWMISIDLLSTEFYHWNNLVPIQTPWACRFYNISFFTISGLNRMLMAFMSIERHFLVFRPHLYRQRYSRYLFHYLPIFLIILWSLGYSIFTDLFLSCTSVRFRYTNYLCGYTCSLLLPNTIMIYVWLQVFFPTFATLISCILLPIRFLLKKRQLQRLQWRRARKMIVQMSIISSTYTFCWLPYTVILQLIVANSLLLSDYNISRIMIFIPYVPSLLTPFICFHTLSDKLKLNFIKTTLHCCFPHRQSLIHPQNTIMTQNRNLNTTKKII